MRGMVAAAVVLAARAAAADDCRAVTVDFTPTDKLQIVAWVETTDGQYVDTAFITESTGTYGIGNRPGVMGTRSGPWFPYGQRLDVLPVWAHRHGVTFPLVVNQWGGDGDPGSDAHDPDRNINSPFGMSSRDTHFCSPMQPANPNWDAITCATSTFTDKGKFSTRTTVYPPRSDVQRYTSDSVDVEQYARMNPFDAVSHATPVGGSPFSFAWPLPATLASGDYKLLVEVSREFDFNATYTETTYPPPDMPWPEYGKPYRGQPSVVYEVPFTVGASTSTGSTMTYVGYSDLDGNLHPPDATITTDTPGSGASRLELVADASGMYRVRATAIPESDSIAPAAPAQLAPVSVSGVSAEFSFVAPGDDGTTGTVSGYDIRYVLGDSLDDASFATAMRAPISVTPAVAGSTQTFSFDLDPGQTYTVGVRAYDNCGHTGPLASVRLTMPSPEVAACGGCASGPASGGGVLLGLLALRRRRR